MREQIYSNVLYKLSIRSRSTVHVIWQLVQLINHYQVLVAKSSDIRLHTQPPSRQFNSISTYLYIYRTKYSVSNTKQYPIKSNRLKNFISSFKTQIHSTAFFKNAKQHTTKVLDTALGSHFMNVSTYLKLNNYKMFQL